MEGNMDKYIEPESNDFYPLFERSLENGTRDLSILGKDNDPENRNSESPHNNFNLMAEPITLAAMGIFVLKGALEALGAKIFNTIFDSGASVKELLKDAVSQIETAIGEAFNAEGIRQCEARIDALTSLMRAYQNAPETSLDRLENATAESNNLTSECKSLGFKAVLPFCTAVGLQIAVLQERLARFNDPGERTTIIQLCEEAYNYAASEAMLDCKLWSDARFSDIEYYTHFEGDPGLPGYYYTFNGEQVYLGQIHHFKDFVVREREEQMIEEVLKLHKGLLYGPAMEIASDIWKLMKKYQDPLRDIPEKPFFREVYEYAAEKGFAGSFPTFNKSGDGQRYEIVLIKSDFGVKQDLQDLHGLPADFPDHIRNVDRALRDDPRYLGGFPNFHRSGRLFGAVRLFKNAGERRWVPTEELRFALTDPNEEYMRKAQNYAVKHGFAGGFPSFEHRGHYSYEIILLSKEAATVEKIPVTSPDM